MTSEPTPPIEITPEMIEAGTTVLYRMTTHIADEEFWAEKVYRAMEAARLSAPRSVP